VEELAQARSEIEARAKAKAMAKEADYAKKMAPGQDGPAQGKKPQLGKWNEAKGTKRNLNSLALSFTKTDAGGFRMSRPGSKYFTAYEGHGNGGVIPRVVSPTAC